MRHWYEPVQVEQVVPSPTQYTLKRIQTPLTYQVQAYLGPDATHTWEIESFNLLVQTSAVVGARVFYLYLDIPGISPQRLLVNSGVTAGVVFYFMALPGGQFSNNFSGNVGTFTVPCPARSLDSPIKLGYYWDNFQDAGDVVACDAVVREYTKVKT